MHVNGTVRAVRPTGSPRLLGVPMPSMKSIVTTGLISLAVIVAYDKYGKR